MKQKTFRRLMAAVVAMSAATVAPVQAQDAPAAASSLLLELNALEPTEQGCRMTFVVMNGLPAALETAGFEIALFNKEGQVDRLTILDFQNLPAGKTKVRRFDLNGTKCADISRILVNDATECAGPGIDPASCIRDLKTQTKSGVTFGS